MKESANSHLPPGIHIAAHDKFRNVAGLSFPKGLHFSASFFLVHRKARNGCSSFRYLHDGGDDSLRHGEYAFCNRRIHVSSLPSATARIAPSPLVRIGFGFKPFLHIRWKCAEEIQSRLSYPLPYSGHYAKRRSVCRFNVKRKPVAGKSKVLVEVQQWNRLRLF